MIINSIIQKSQLEGTHRLDAEYYQPEYLEANRLVASKQHSKFGKIMFDFTDYHANGSYEILRKNVEILDDKNFALMVRTTDLENRNFDDDVKYISKSSYNFLKKTQVFGGEIIINKIGSPGKVYLMPHLNKPVSLGMNQFMIRLDNTVNTNYVYVFLTSKYGEKLINQRITGAVPLSIDKESIRNIKIPILSEAVQDEVSRLVEESNELDNNASLYYEQAENLFLKKLDLGDFNEEEDLFSVANLSEVEVANRIDAEYFQMKYKNLESRIKNNKFEKLGNLASIKKGVETGAENYQDDGKKFIRVSNLSKYGISDSNQKYISDILYDKLKKDYEPKKGEMLLTKDATPGIAYVLSKDVEEIISGGILRLKLKKDIDAEYLALCINSIIGQMQAERDAGGSIIKHWKPEQIKNVLIPILPKQTQQKIADLVKQSHEARKKSKELLEEAKRKVEELIENK